jgi:hypothetical protein
MNSPNYRDFYPKALLPIGSNDYILINTNDSTQIEPPSTHWLIALEGEKSPQEKEYYYWKVSIYPSNSEGTFDFRKPYFSSTLHDCIHKAFESARILEFHGQNDELCSPATLEKIS